MEESEQSVIDIFSNTFNSWFVGLAIRVGQDALMVRFLDPDGAIRQKNSSSDDPILAPFGTKTLRGALPPGFIRVPSNTRPGQFSYFDPYAKRKLATLNLAWKAFLHKRLVEAGADGIPQAADVNQQHFHSYNPPKTSLVAPPIPNMDAGYERVLQVPTPHSHIHHEVVEHVDTQMDQSLFKAFSVTGSNTNSASLEAALRGWSERYVHRPVEETAVMVYFNSARVDFMLYSKTMQALAEINHVHRDRMIAEIESGSVMATSIDVFCSSNYDTENCLHWEGGAIMNFVASVFHSHSLAWPTEDLIYQYFEILDEETRERLGACRCICLVDALMRSTFIKKLTSEDLVEDGTGVAHASYQCLPYAEVSNVSGAEEDAVADLRSPQTTEVRETTSERVATKLSVADFVESYTHLPVQSTLGLVYFNTTPVNFTLYTEIMMPISFINEDRRDRIIAEIENGAVMNTSLDMFCRSDVDSEGDLHWESGGVRDFVIWVFHQHDLDAPTEDLIRPLFEAFDLKKQEKLGAWEGICLADAVMRAAFLKKFVMPEAPEGEDDDQNDEAQ